MEGEEGILPEVKLLSFWFGEIQTLARKISFHVISSQKDAEVDNQARYPCSDLLLPSVFFSTLAISLILDLESNLNSNCFFWCSCRTGVWWEGKHPVYTTVRKKNLKSLFGFISFQKRERDEKVEPSCISSHFPFLSFFSKKREPMCHVSCNTGYIHHRWPGSFVLVVYSLLTCIVFSCLKYSTLMRYVSVQMYAVRSWKMLW